MSRRTNSLRWRVGTLALSFGLAAGGVAVLTSGPAVAGSTPAPLDHFLCYHAAESGLKPPSGVMLKNIIQPALFAPALGAASIHCNPANKALAVAVFTAKNPLAHLLCFNANSPYKPVLVHVANQFGTASMKTTGSPNSLCLPTWKDNVSPPNQTPNQPPNLDHFTCYTVLPTSLKDGSYALKAPASVKVMDEFSAPLYVGEKISVANDLCVPTTKVVAGAVFAPQTPVDLSLLCFPGVPTPIWKVVYDQNQFGSGKIFPTNQREELCLPTKVQLG